MTEFKHPLGQDVGYGVVIGVGFLFAFGMILTTFILKRYNYELQTSEMFSTAGRTVKSGLVASAVVSSWTWAATLMQSTAVAYKYGVSGPFWYASGATVQIILFATLAIELKRRAPNAHTFLEVIKARYGTITHIVYMCFGLFTNILVSAMLLTGGSATTNALTGMPVPAACFLLPVGVVMYTLFGGIKATFITDYMHTVILFIILLMFAFQAYSTNENLGSAGKVFDLLVQAAKDHPVDGNKDGSYLTMRSSSGVIFFIVNIVGNFGTVFCDNGYYNKAIAASPVHALPGYVFGGLAWFSIPFMAATTMGLAGLALENNEVWPTYPDRMDPSDVSKGLVLPATAVALMGKGGAVAALLLVFMAVTSAMSAELIAVSTIWTYDFWKTYVNPNASGRTLIAMSHASVIAYAVAIAGFSTGLYYIGISLGYLYVMMGCIISSAVLPTALALIWSGQNWWAATFSPPLGLICALIGWFVRAKKEFGELTVETTGSDYPILVGNVVALLSPCIFIPVFTLIFGVDKYDWVSMKEIRKADDSDLAGDAHMDLELIPGGHLESAAEEEAEQAQLRKSGRIARWMTVFMTIALLVLWPMPMYGSAYIFSKKFFVGWIVVGFIWLFFSATVVGLYPLWEGRATMARTFKAIVAELQGKRSHATALDGHQPHFEDSKGTSTPEKVTVEPIKE